MRDPVLNSLSSSNTVLGDQSWVQLLQACHPPTVASRPPRLFHSQPAARQKILVWPRHGSAIELNTRSNLLCLSPDGLPCCRKRVRTFAVFPHPQAGHPADLHCRETRESQSSYPQNPKRLRGAEWKVSRTICLPLQARCPTALMHNFVIGEYSSFRQRHPPGRRAGCFLVFKVQDLRKDCNIG